MKRLVFLGFVALAVGGLWSGAGLLNSVVGQERGASSKQSAIITVNRCRIKLIDEATLSIDRYGTLAFIGPQEGDRVKEGQEVVGLVDNVPRARYNTAKERSKNDIEIRFAKKAAEVARIEYEKALDANRRIRDAFSDLEVRRLKLAAERSDLSIENAQKDFELNKLLVDEAQAELNTYQIKAPFDGIVIRVLASKGEALRQGDPILEMVNTDRVKVEGYIEAKDRRLIKAGARVIVSLNDAELVPSGTAGALQGRIEFVDVSVQPVTGKVRVWAEVANKENILLAGKTATMKIYPGQILAKKSAARSVKPVTK